MFPNLIEKRRSIRKYQDRPVEPPKVDSLVEAALRAPSSRGINPWEFVVVTDRQLLEKLSCAKSHGASHLRGAPLGIVVCADATKSDVWVEDASIASTFLLLAAESLGLGACWVQIRRRMYDEKTTANEKIGELLGLPKDLEVESIVAVGYPDEVKPPHGRGELLFARFHRNAYGSPYGTP